MHAVILRPNAPPARAVAALVAWHGFWPVARALIAQALHRPVHLPGPEVLSDHIRRDLGLPPLAGHAPPRRGA